MKHEFRNKLFSLTIKGITAIIILHQIIENFFEKDITKDDPIKVIILLSTIVLTATYLFEKLHLILLEQARKQKAGENIILTLLILLGIYTIYYAIGYQFITDQTIYKFIKQNNITQKIALSYTIWIIFACITLRDKHEKGGKIKMVKPNLKVFSCSLKSKDSGNVMHFLINAETEIECVRKAEKKYDNLPWPTISNFVGEENITLDQTKKRIIKKPDFNNTELKFICLGRPGTKNYINEEKWPDEIELEENHPLRKMVKTI